MLGSFTFQMSLKSCKSLGRFKRHPSGTKMALHTCAFLRDEEGINTCLRNHDYALGLCAMRRSIFVAYSLT